MKIGILTHPQAINYGGILQCYALSVFLQSEGYEVLVIRRGQDISWLKQKILLFLKILHIPPYYHPKSEDKGKNIRIFSENKLKRTKLIHTQSGMKKICKKYGLDAVIVGSDQVWRTSFAMTYGYNYFLDFVPDNVKKVAYAASFGLREWQYNINQTRRISQLLKRFSGVSVREADAVAMCMEQLGIRVQQMVDPTLLLRASDYDEIASPRQNPNHYIFIYWLGEENLVKNEIEKCKLDGKDVIYVSLRNNCVLPSIENWLSYIKYADGVITDSFHGAVFSFIYHRPLQIMANSSGGYGRIESLLQLFDVRMKQLPSINEQDFERTDAMLKYYRKETLNFIKKSLK